MQDLFDDKSNPIDTCLLPNKGIRQVRLASSQIQETVQVPLERIHVRRTEYRLHQSCIGHDIFRKCFQLFRKGMVLLDDIENVIQAFERIIVSAARASSKVTM